MPENTETRPQQTAEDAQKVSDGEISCKRATEFPQFLFYSRETGRQLRLLLLLLLLLLALLLQLPPLLLPLPLKPRAAAALRAMPVRPQLQTRLPAADLLAEPGNRELLMQVAKSRRSNRQPRNRRRKVLRWWMRRSRFLESRCGGASPLFTARRICWAQKMNRCSRSIK